MLAVSLTVFLLNGCAGIGTAPWRQSGPRLEYFLISNGWHTAVALPRREIPPDLLRMATDFPTARCLVIGWGDLDFYLNRNHSPWAIFHALCLPSASALHVVAVHAPIARRFPHSEILRFSASKEQFASLCRALDREFATKKGNIVRLGDGNARETGFYLGRAAYSAANTCNIWTARIILAAGAPVHPASAFVADDLMWQARKHAVRINALSRPRDGF